MEGDWASRRALAWARLRRKIVFEAGEEERREREELLGDEKERLGAEILEVFEDLRGRPDLVEAFSLYIGVGQGPLVIHGGKVGERAGCLFHEVFRLDGHGRLVYEFSGPERGEAVTWLGLERDLLNREVVLEVPGDFRRLS